MKKILAVAAAALAFSALAEDVDVYKMDYATVERGSMGIRDGTGYFKVNERHMMPATCIRSNNIHIDGKLELSELAFNIIYQNSLQGVPFAFLSWTVASTGGDCYLKNFRFRDVSDAASYNLSRIYLHNTIQEDGQLHAEGCPYPYNRQSPDLGFEYQTKVPGGQWSATYGGLMVEYVGTTCATNSILGFSLNPGHELRWRVTDGDGYHTDWTEIVF